MIISFIGNDGGGKSTTIRELTKDLEAEGKRVVRVRGFDHLFLDTWKRWYAKISGETAEKLQAEYSNKGRRKLFSLWPYLIFIDCCGLLLKYSFRLNTIFIFDRYPYDYVPGFEELGLSNPFIRRIFLMLPKPTHIFLLDVSPGIARERKKEDHTDDLGYYERQRARYLKLAVEKKIETINTDRKAVTEVVQLVRLSLKSFGPSFVPRGNKALRLQN